MANVILRNVFKSYGETEVLRNVNLTLNDGEFIVFVGPSGCGKTTLMRMVAGLEEITHGDVFFDDVRVNDFEPSKRGISMVFQSYALYPHMSVYDNMAFGLKLSGKNKSETDQAVRSAAKTLNIDHLLKRKPKELSGGQRQRVAIGRAITRTPKVFLFDEPLSNLDAALRVKMRLEFSRLHEALKSTMIYVTHDQVEAMTLADRIVVLSAGNVEQIGEPERLYHAPANRFVAAFLGSPKMNFLSGEIAQIENELITVDYGNGDRQKVAVLPGAAQVGQPVTIGIRPEHLSADSGENGVAASTLTVESLGDLAYMYAEAITAPDGLIARVEPLQRHTGRESVKLGATPENCYLFDHEGVAFERVYARRFAWN